MASDEEGIRTANRAFYRALSKGDLGAMDRLWSTAFPVVCIHPGWQPLFGREPVMASFRAIFASGNAPAISCTDERVIVLGEAGIVVCNERLGDAVLAATNCFVREGDRFRIVQHQSAAYEPGRGAKLAAVGSRRKSSN